MYVGMPHLFKAIACKLPLTVCQWKVLVYVCTFVLLREKQRQFEVKEMAVRRLRVMANGFLYGF